MREVDTYLVRSGGNNDSVRGKLVEERQARQVAFHRCLTKRLVSVTFQRGGAPVHSIYCNVEFALGAGHYISASKCGQLQSFLGVHTRCDLVNLCSWPCISFH